MQHVSKRYARTNRVRCCGLPSVAVAGGEAHVAIGEVVVVDERAKLATKEWGLAHSTVPVANDSLGHQRGEVVIILPAHTLNSKSNMGSANGIVADTDLGSDEVGLALLLRNDAGSSGGWGCAGKAAEVLLSKLHELVMGDTAGTDEDHAVSSVVGLDVVNEVVALDASDVLLGSKDSAAEGLVLEGGGMEVVEDDFLELLINLLLFTQNHISLPFNGGRLQLGVLKDVGENIDGLGDVGVEGLGIVNCVFPLHD